MNRGKRGRREEWQREISDSHNFSLQRFTHMNPLLTSEIDLNLQQPIAKLWWVQGLIITADVLPMQPLPLGNISAQTGCQRS